MDWHRDEGNTAHWLPLRAGWALQGHNVTMPWACRGMASHPELRVQATACLGCPPCHQDQGNKVSQELLLWGHVVQSAASTKAPWQWGQGPASTPCSILCSWLAAVVVHSLPGGKRAQAPVTLSFCCSSRCQGYSQKEKAPRLPQGTWVESRGSHPLQRQGFGRTLGGDEGQGGTQQCHIPSPGPASAQVGGSLLWWEGMRAPSRCQAVG